MSYRCPNCGEEIDESIFFQVTGQFICNHCGEIVDLTNANTDTIDEEIEDDDQEH